MSLINRIKVRIKNRTSGTSRNAPPPIEVREIEVFICRNCHNRYHAHHWYCPQCLGEVQPVKLHVGSLKLLSIAEGRSGDLQVVLQALSGRKDFEYQKAFNSLPWIMIEDTDRSILQHWKEVLLAEKAEADIYPYVGQQKNLVEEHGRRYSSPVRRFHFFYHRRLNQKYVRYRNCCKILQSA
ncbi:MAG TPA: hypothetical protein VLH08_17640 [Acidobacteriota bacterium]|nr:hypothetical protein [Acidobacteriota bacterium]